MDIAKDLFPTDSRSPYFTLTLSSRDLSGHSLLTALEPEQRAAVNAILAQAAAALDDLLRGLHETSGPAAGTSSFGCGT